MTKGKKRARGLLLQDPALQHQFASTGQPSHLDLSKPEDDAALPRGGIGNAAPTERGGDEDESPRRRRRALIREEEKEQGDEARSVLMSSKLGGQPLQPRTQVRVTR